MLCEVNNLANIPFVKLRNANCSTFLLDTLYIFFPGEYILGAVLFLVTLFVLQRDIQYIQMQEQKKLSEQPQEPVQSQSTSGSSYGSTATLPSEDVIRQ